MAPERFSDDLIGALIINAPSKESDIYSLAMTSFEVRSSIVNHPTIRYNRSVVIRSSRGYCHMMTPRSVI
jgi:hypothetical protein